ncbi:hypothetical protein ACVIGA_006047 [Bradyrhizobium sp. USDA 3240]
MQRIVTSMPKGGKVRPYRRSRMAPITHGNVEKKRSRSDAATDGDRSGREI